LLGIRPVPSAKEKQQLIDKVVSFYLRGMLDEA